MLFLGIDLGTSSVKVSVVDMDSQQILSSASFPDVEAPIAAPQRGWAEQDPEDWWHFTKEAIRRCHASGSYRPADIQAIGIAYQMHGLVLVDKQQQVLRPAIIWCDSRAVKYGDAAFAQLGADYCLPHLLNSPGNFTAAKLAWVKEEEPEVYDRIHRFLLPGDFIAMKLTGECSSTISALSEGIFWDFQRHEVSRPLLDFFGFDESLFPSIKPVLGEHGRVSQAVADDLLIAAGTPVTYKAGDQLNNAIALSVTSPGQLAATGGTSGVLYGVGEKLNYDRESRINSFAHVTHTQQAPRIGTLLCINGAGIFYKWFKQQWAPHRTYQQINAAAASVASGSEGVLALPFGNGAERMLNNRDTGAAWLQIDLNKHGWEQAARATLEGIGFAFRYGFDIIRENGEQPMIMRAPRANLFLSEVFAQTLADLTGIPIEFYEGDGSYGAATGAWMGLEAASGRAVPDLQRPCTGLVEPVSNAALNDQWGRWKQELERQLAVK